MNATIPGRGGQLAARAEAALSEAEIRVLNAEFEYLSPTEILRWAVSLFPGTIAASSSFQSQSMPLLHMIATAVPELPILFLDTGFHFPQTLSFRDRLVEEWGLNLVDLTYSGGHERFRRNYGELHRSDPDECCRLNKVLPMGRALSGYSAWIAGIRRDQTENRRDTPVLSVRADGLVKICPIAAWTERDVASYIARHSLPVHPLLAEGYLSIGCAPCTRSAFDGGRSGRWANSSKTECGLHLDLPVRPESGATAAVAPERVASSPDSSAASHSADFFAP